MSITELLHEVAEENQHWRDLAACKGMDPSLFFPSRGDNNTLKQAKRVCTGADNGGIECPVRKACQDYAVVNGEESGVWGGKTIKDFKQIRRQRRRPVV